MSIEAMKQALEALEEVNSWESATRWNGCFDEEITSLRQAIADLEKQEAVGVVGMDVSRPHISYGGQYLGQKPDTKTAMLFKDLEVGTKLYIHPQPKAEKQEPVCAMCRSTHGKWSWMCGRCLLIHDKHPHPKREWVGLTDEEIEQGNKESWVDKQAWESAVWWAEARLKGKNT